MRLRLIATVSILLFVSVPLLASGSVSDGATVYKSKCAACHGPDGAGQTSMGKTLKVRDLRSDEVQKQTDVELTKVISGGKGKMPPYGKQLTTPQIESLIAYIRTLKAK